MRLDRKRAGTSAAFVTAIALLVSGSVVTNASWQDREFAHDTLGTSDCAAPGGGFASRGEGRLLSGSLLDIDLDTLVEARGVLVTNDGTRSAVEPDSATPAPEQDAYADPLSIEVFDAVNPELTGLLQLPLGIDLGVAGQYAQATAGGDAVGAAGAVTSSGGIALAPAAGYPEFATLRLSDIVAAINPPVASALAGVADVSLVTGAVTGRAALAGCELAWSGDAAATVTRDYLAASLRTEIESSTVGALLSGVRNSVDALQTAVDGLAGDAGVTSGIASGLTALLNAVLDGPGGSRTLGLGQTSIDSLTAAIDLGPVRSLITEPFGDSGGVLRIDPATATISVDAAALLEAAYPGHYSAGLNGLPPNTDLFGDPAIVDALTRALTAALDDWVAGVDAALRATIDSIAISVQASVALEVSVSLVPLAPPSIVPIGAIEVGVDGSLGDLLAGDVRATARLALLDDPLPVVGSLVSGTLQPVLTLLQGALVAGAGAVVGGAVDGAVATFRMLPTAVVALAEPVVEVVSLVYRELFLAGVVAVTVNAQNDPLAGLAEPDDWASLPDRRFEVAAMRVGVLGALGAADTHVYLGRGSVGPGCSAAGSSLDLECARY